MQRKTIVIYNHTCPICRREIDAYRRISEAENLPLSFLGIDSADLPRWGLTPTTAAKRLHVVEDGQRIDGLDAFAAVWNRIPRLRWLARFVRRPWVHPVADWIYERILAPILFAMHRRRQRKGA